MNVPGTRTIRLSKAQRRSWVVEAGQEVWIRAGAHFQNVCNIPPLPPGKVGIKCSVFHLWRSPCICKPFFVCVYTCLHFLGLYIVVFFVLVYFIGLKEKVCILNRKDATETYKPLSLSIIKGWDIRKRNVEYSDTIMTGLSKEALGCHHLVHYPQRPALGTPLENNITG